MFESHFVTTKGFMILSYGIPIFNGEHSGNRNGSRRKKELSALLAAQGKEVDEIKVIC